MTVDGETLERQLAEAGWAINKRPYTPELDEGRFGLSMEPAYPGGLSPAQEYANMRNREIVPWRAIKWVVTPNGSVEVAQSGDTLEECAMRCRLYDEDRVRRGLAA